LGEILPHLDERTLFAARWGLRGTPQEIEAEARPRLRALLDEIRTRSLVQAAVAYGWFPAARDGDALQVSGPQGPVRWTFPRQGRDPFLALPDFFAESQDIIGLQVVTMGPRFTEEATALHQAGRYRDYLELHGLGVQLAEAFAEYWHGRMREDVGIRAGERFSFGYPACPDLGGRRDLLRLVGAERIGVTVTDGEMLVPEQSTDALIVHHPLARHFTMRGGT
jgi:5-methyltetrahydrofolate--homocysteine methyltransferase